MARMIKQDVIKEAIWVVAPQSAFNFDLRVDVALAYIIKLPGSHQPRQGSVRGDSPFTKSLDKYIPLSINNGMDLPGMKEPARLPAPRATSSRFGDML